MIHIEKDNNGISQHVEGIGETLLTELMVAINAFKEEGFPKELINLAVDFAYSVDIPANEINPHPEDDNHFDSRNTEELKQTFDSIFGDIFKNKE